MNKEIATLITQIARIRNVDITYVTETLRLSVITGLKRRYGPDIKPEVEIHPEQGDMRIFLFKTVVSDVKNDGIEMSEYEARKLKSDARAGEELKVEVPLGEVGRIAIRKTSEELVLKLREAERTKLYDEYLKKRSEIVTGTIQKIGRDEIIVSLGLVEASLPTQEQLKTDHYRQGAPIKALIFRVEKTPLGPRILLSRTHPDFLKRLLAKEIPEIRQGVVEIRALSRAPSFRSKVAVYCADERIDPVGACVGYRKSRIENVIKELSGEKIDIVQWSKDMQVFVSRALGPAKVKQVIPEGDAYIVVVPDAEFSIAIGKKGQNVWLAGLLVGAKLEVLKETDFNNRELMTKAAEVSLVEFELGAEVTTKLQDAQILNAFDLLSIPAPQVAEATGLESDVVEELKQRVREKMRLSEEAAERGEIEGEGEGEGEGEAEAEAAAPETEPESPAEPQSEEHPQMTQIAQMRKSGVNHGVRGDEQEQPQIAPTRRESTDFADHADKTNGQSAKSADGVDAEAGAEQADVPKPPARKPRVRRRVEPTAATPEPQPAEGPMATDKAEAEPAKPQETQEAQKSQETQETLKAEAKAPVAEGELASADTEESTPGNEPGKS